MKLVTLISTKKKWGKNIIGIMICKSTDYIKIIHQNCLRTKELHQSDPWEP